LFYSAEDVSIDAPQCFVRSLRCAPCDDSLL